MDLVSERPIDMDLPDLAAGSHVVGDPCALRPAGEVGDLAILDVRVQPRGRDVQVDAVHPVVEVLWSGPGAPEIGL